MLYCILTKIYIKFNIKQCLNYKKILKFSLQTVYMTRLQNLKNGRNFLSMQILKNFL